MVAPHAPTFVRREAELERLDGLLDRTLEGRGQTAFVTGEAGAGKTSLVAEFARRAEARRGDLLYAYADCDARTGAGDAYLPFREVLALLAGDTEAEVAQGNISEESATRLKRFLSASGEVVFEAGTEVLGAFLPGAGLLAKLAARLARRGGGDQGRSGLAPAQIQEQYTNIIRAAAARQPLVVVVEDLHWADAASLDLYFHLARRLEGSRVLLLGTYRPNDVALGRDGDRHPLAAVAAELRRYGGEAIDLDAGDAAERRAFVTSLLETRPNRFDPAFLDRLVAHTDGHALFVVEVLAALEERGGIARGEDGVWVQARDIDWGRIPARIEGVIEERFHRLDGELRTALEVASVEGDEFSAEVVARVESLEPRHLIRRLSGEADRRHRLVAAQGVRRVGPSSYSAYRFRHALFQHYLYHGIDAVERSHLHRAVGEALEELLGPAAVEHAVRLADHFIQAGDADRSADYLLAAGRRAHKLAAYAEALVHFRRGIDVLDGVPTTPERDRRLLDLLATAGVCLVATRGFADPEVQRVYDRAHALVETIGDDDDLLPVLFGILTFNLARGRLADARSIAARRVPLARRQGDPDPLREALVSLGFVAFYMGDLAEAEATIREAAEIHVRPEGAAATELFDPGGSIRRGLALLQWLTGRPAEARSSAEDAIRVTRDADSRYGAAAALGFAAVVASWEDDIEGTLRLAAECHELSEAEGYAFWIAFGGILRDWAAARLALTGGETRHPPEQAADEADGAMARLAAVVERFAAAGTELWQPFFLALLADLQARTGDAGGAGATLDRALETARRTEEVFWRAELLRCRAELLAPTDRSAARELLTEAVQVARRQGAVALERRAAVSLTSLESPPAPAGGAG